MANTGATWQQAAHATYQLSSRSCSTRAIQKSPPHKGKVQCFQACKMTIEMIDKWVISPRFNEIKNGEKNVYVGL